MEDDLAVCDGDGHAVTIVGVRKACCDKRCMYEWNLSNSYGQNSDGNGWHQASSLAWSTTLFKQGITDVIDCKTGPDGLPADDCKYSIQGKYPIHYLARAGDAGKLAAFLAKSKRVVKALNELDLDGNTPLMEAIMGASMAKPEKSLEYAKIIQALINAGADPNVHGFGSPLWFALSLSSPDIAWLLIQNNARFFSSAEEKAEAMARLGPNDLTVNFVPVLDGSPQKDIGCNSEDKLCSMKERKNNNVLIIKERLLSQRSTE